MTKKMSKSASQRWHAKWALRKRYGIFCNRYLYRFIVDMLKRGESELLIKQSYTREIHRIMLPVEQCQHKETVLKVPIEDGCIKVYLVYNPRNGELRSVLPWYANDSDFLTDYKEHHES